MIAVILSTSVVSQHSTTNYNEHYMYNITILNNRNILYSIRKCNFVIRILHFNCKDAYTIKENITIYARI